jgi:hypothetical protein
LNLAFTRIIEHAKERATKVIIKKVDNINLPRETLELIAAKNHAKKLSLKYNTPFFKARFNQLTKIVNRDETKK